MFEEAERDNLTEILYNAHMYRNTTSCLVIVYIVCVCVSRLKMKCVSEKVELVKVLSQSVD